VFGRDGSLLTTHEVRRAFSVAKRISGIRRELTPHSLRRTFGSCLAIARTPLRTIQELMGHADIRMTIRCAHLSPAHLRDAIELIGSAENSNRLRAAREEGRGKWRQLQPCEW
jgi:integrase